MHKMQFFFEMPFENRCERNPGTPVSGFDQPSEENLMAWKKICVVAMAVLWVAPAAYAESTWLNAGGPVLAQGTKEAAPAPAPVAKVQEEKAVAKKPDKPIPLTFTVDYVLISDYVFRGINISEYRGEGVERPNHQMNVNIELDLKEFGSLGTNLWVELFGADLGGDGDFKQVNYDVYYRYKFNEIGLSLTGGWITRSFPPQQGDAHATNEVYLIAAYDDAKLFGTRENIFNPYVAYYHDLDLADHGSWWEFGISHPFKMAEHGLQDCPVMRHVTVTPSLVYGVQHRYYGNLNPAEFGKSTSAVNLLFGLEIGYDLSKALNIPEECGKLGVAGLLYYSQAIDHAIANDEFFGGMKVSYKY